MITTLSPISPQPWSAYMGKCSSQSLTYAWDIITFASLRKTSTRPPSKHNLEHIFHMLCTLDLPMHHPSSNKRCTETSSPCSKNIQKMSVTTWMTGGLPLLVTEKEEDPHSNHP
jgi:hypothetical protein